MRLALLCYSLLTAFAAAHAAAAPIHPGLNTSLCLDVAGASPANGTKVQIAHCYGNQAQDWQYTGGQLKALGKCLDVAGGNTTSGVRLQIWDCNGSGAQQWQLSGGAITWKGQGKCVDVPAGQAKDGQSVQSWPCNKTKAQQWQTALVLQAAQPQAPVASAPNNGATSAGNGRLLTFKNQCTQPVWVALQQNGGKKAPNPSGFKLDQGQTFGVAVDAQWGGRAWGRTGCTGSGNNLKCESGDAAGLLQPNGLGGQPSGLVEYTFNGWAGPNATQDYYDGSFVDAADLPMGLYPQGGTGKCYAPVCKVDLLARCPADLQVKNGAGKVVTCLSSCTRYQTDATCCRGAHATPDTCPAPEGAKYFKSACPDFYSYAYDDLSSTFNCTNPTGYLTVFCP